MGVILSNPVYIWLAAGALLIAFEALTAPGLGIFLGGLGAITTGIFIEAGYIAPDEATMQFASFFGFTTLWAIILWRPLIKFRSSKGSASSYSDTVGGIAIVGGEGLKRGETGQVIWSGTHMNAVLEDSAPVDSLPAGTSVIIKSVSGNTFTVTPK